MKACWLLLIALAVSGCSTPKSVASLQGHGTKRVFHAAYDPVWNAALIAAEMDYLRVIDADPARGFISARRRMSATTFGENVAIWVHSVAPASTSVEVVSRQTAPWFSIPPDWPNHVLGRIRDILT